MLPIKRLEEIKRILTENKQADVPSLAQELNVTEATIRRDLEKLENEQFLTRTHGGAVLNEPKHSNISLFQLPDDRLQPLHRGFKGLRFCTHVASSCICSTRAVRLPLLKLTQIVSFSRTSAARLITAPASFVTML